MTGGYIKFYRKTWNNPIVTADPETFIVWWWLVSHATHSSQDAIFNGERITLKPGQLLTGRKQIALETKVNESKVSRILKRLKIEQQIEQQTDRRGSLISIVNWREYQQSEQQNEQQVNSYRTASEQLTNTYKNEKNDIREEYLSLKDEARSLVCNDEARARLDEIRKTIRENRRTQ